MPKLALKIAAGFLFLSQGLVAAAYCDRNVWHYYPYWGSYNASNIPYTKLTHIAHSFVGPNADGSLDVPGGFLEPALITNANANGVKVIVSVGGASATYDANFRTIAASAALRTAFIDNLEAFMRSNGYHGVDVDWEFPRDAADRANLNLLIQGIRAKFNASAAPAPTWLITAAVSWGNWYGQWWDVDTLKNYMDYFNIMVYDMFGDWESRAGHNAALDDPASAPAAFGGYNGVAVMNYWIGTRGLPVEKVQYGLPFYGYRYPQLENIYDVQCSTCTASQRAYNLVAGLVGAGWTRTFEALADSPYLRQDAGAGLISYDDPQSIAAKTTWALWTRGVAGVFAWEISQDFLGPGNQPLVDAMWNAAQCPGTPTVTRTFTVTRTISPSRTASVTASPTRTASLTRTETRTASPSFTPTPSYSETAQQSATVSPSESPTPLDSPTASPTSSEVPPGPTQTWTPSQVPSDTVSPTPTATETSLQSFTATPSATETLLQSPTASPTESSTSTAPPAAATQAPGGGALKIKRVVPVPNPNPGVFSVELDGPVDELVLRFYTNGMALALEIKSGPAQAGWVSIPLPPGLMAGLAGGSWHYVLAARRGAESTHGVPGSFYLFR